MQTVIRKGDKVDLFVNSAKVSADYLANIRVNDQDIFVKLGSRFDKNAFISDIQNAGMTVRESVYSIEVNKQGKTIEVSDPAPLRFIDRDTTFSVAPWLTEAIVIVSVSDIYLADGYYDPPMHINTSSAKIIKRVTILGKTTTEELPEIEFICYNSSAPIYDVPITIDTSKARVINMSYEFTGLPKEFVCSPGDVYITECDLSIKNKYNGSIKLILGDNIIYNAFAYDRLDDYINSFVAFLTRNNIHVQQENNKYTLTYAEPFTINVAGTVESIFGFHNNGQAVIDLQVSDIIDINIRFADDDITLTEGVTSPNALVKLPRYDHFALRAFVNGYEVNKINLKATLQRKKSN